MGSRFNIPIVARCLALTLAFCALATPASQARTNAQAPPPADFTRHPGLADQADPRNIAHIQGDPLPPEHRPPRHGDALHQSIDYSRPLHSSARPKAVCDIAQFAQATPATIVSVVQAASVACVNENFSADGTLDAAIFTEAKMTAVAEAYLAAAQSYPGNNSTKITQLIMFLRTGYYASDRSALTFDTPAFHALLKSAIRAFGNHPNLNAPASAEHGYALRDSLILIRAVDAITENFDTLAKVLGNYDSASYRGIFEMRGAVSQVNVLAYNLQWEPNSEANTIADDKGFREALRDFVRDNCAVDCSLSQTSYLMTDAAYELGRFLKITSNATFRQETRDLVKSLTSIYSLENQPNVFLKLAEMVHWYDSANCAWYGPGVCTAMQDLQEMILPSAQTRVCHAGKLRIRNHDLTTTQLDYICETLAQQKSAFMTLMGTTEDQPVADDFNDTLEVVIFKNQNHYTSYSTTFFGNSTNNGGIYLEGTPSNPGNTPRFITFVAPSSWTRPSGIWEPWNLHHEYTHYLDGRYNFKGGFGALPGTAPYSAVWFTEGVGEYMAQFFLSNLPAPSPGVATIAEQMAASFLTRNDDNVWYVGDTPSRNVPLSTVFNNQYGVSPQDNIYTWGYLATRFMFERYRSSMDAMLAVARAGDYAPGYRNWLDNVRDGKDQEFRTWLDCYLLNNTDTTSCNQDVASRIFSDEFEGEAPPPPPLNIPVELPVCSSNTSLANGCKHGNLQASGSSVIWLSIIPPANVKTLKIKSRNGLGDVDIYAAPSPTWPYPTTVGAWSSNDVGNTEEIVIENPTPNVWINIGLHAKNGDYFSGVDVYAYWLMPGQEDIDPSFGDGEEPDPEPEPEPDPGENPDPIPDVAHLPDCENDYILSTSCKIVGLSANGNNSKTFYFQVLAGSAPAKATIRTFGGSGDADMYYSLPGSAYPTTAIFEASSTFTGSNETIALTAPVSGYHNVALFPKGGGSFAGVTAVVLFEEDEEEPVEPSLPDLPECTATDVRQLDPGCKRSGAEQSNANWFTWFLTYVPAGTNSLTINSVGGTGDADMYVGDAGVWPSATAYAHLSANAGNEESVTINAPASGWYYIGLRPKSSNFSGVSIYITRN